MKPHTTETPPSTALDCVRVSKDIPHKVIQLETDLEAFAITIKLPFVLTVASVYLICITYTWLQGTGM